MAGLRALSIEGRFPRPDRSMVFDVWVYLEHPDPVESEHVRVQVDPLPDGERGRAP